MPTRPLLAAAVALALLAGCATSAQFQYAASVSGRDLAAEATAYVTADATLDAATRDRRLAAASALNGSAATTRSVTDQGVYAAWATVSPWLRAYIAADPRLPDRFRARHLARCDKLDALIAAEAKRPFGASTRPVGG